MPEILYNPPIQQEIWVSISFLTLFAIFVFAFVRSHNWLIRLYDNFTKVHHSNTSSIKKTAEEEQSHLFMSIFSIGVITLYISIMESEFIAVDFTTYIKLFALGTVFILIKNQIVRFLAYVFLITEESRLAKEQYFNLLFFLSTLLYPLLILRCFMFENQAVFALDLIAIILIIITFALIIIVLFQFFYRKLLDSLHIMLYLCTLEFLPYFGMYYAFRWVIYGL